MDNAANAIQTTSIWKPTVVQHTLTTATRTTAAISVEVDTEANAIDKREEKERENYYFPG
jgi:hypothetical protein